MIRRFISWFASCFCVEPAYIFDEKTYQEVFGDREMVYSTPKAADFIAAKNGGIMDEGDSLGRSLRWTAANAARDYGIDFLHLKTGDFATLSKICAAVCEHRTDGIRVGVARYHMEKKPRSGEWRPADDCPHCGQYLCELLESHLAEMPEDTGVVCKCGNVLKVHIKWVAEFMLQD